MPKFIIILILAIFLNGCKSFDEKDEFGKKKRIEPNVRKKIEAAEGGIFTSGKNKDLLGTNNPMWKATLSVLDFTPLTTASYNGGIIVTDWYTQPGSKESIKISVVFLSNEISTNSIEVKSYKKVCDTNNNCNNSLMSENFNFQIKQKILREVKNFEKSNKK
jgi:hypothetical protein